MPARSDATALYEWVTAVATELGLEEAVDSDTIVNTVLDLTGDVAHHVSRPVAPVTAFLVGVAAGRAADPKLAARDLGGRIARLAEGWNA